KWGLSAAGYLEPKVFTFFNNMGVTLCSGFGMTEATGGISMTPPGEYTNDSVGIPLPGIQTTLNENGELVISGHYVGEYLDEDKKGSIQEDKSINTGDLFVQDSNEHLFIIDRIKDIYKNIKGQTIAPAFIEKKFDRIPGFKRVFLAGDMKPFNSLLIVPDNEDPFIEKLKSEEDLKNYYSSIVSNINKGLQPYERILKFLILSKDFDVNKGELTAKGTFNRKIIRENFVKEISELYRKNDLEFTGHNLKIILPIWMLKDIGISEEEVGFHNSKLFVKGTDKSLTIKLKKKSYNTVNFESSKNYNHIQIGTFDYLIEDKVVDLGLFIRQPFFWVANLELINFFKCKEDWETLFAKISTQLFLADKYHPENYNHNVDYLSSHIKDINFNCIKIIFGSKEEVLVSLNKLEKVLSTGENNIANMVSRRIEILAYNNDFEIRSTAYKIMLLNQPKIDYNKYLPSFINSGKNFLNKKVIEEILYSNFEGFNLEALRQRLESYRTGLNWPLPKKYVNHFKRIFELLAYFAHKNPASYTQIRAELIAWILHRKDLKIAAAAQDVFNNLFKWWESRFKLTPYEKDENNWNGKLVFQSIITKKEIERLKNVLICTSFLREAFQLLIQNETFDLLSIQDKGIFISRLSSAHKSFLYRVSVNTKKQKHFDFIIFIKPDLSTKKVQDTIYLMIKIADKASGQSILPKLGNFRSDLGILSIAFINDLNVQERIRQITSTVSTLKYEENVKTLELLFKRGMAGYFKFLKDSEYSIIPGNISPYNVVVAEPFYKEGITILSITGWEDFKDYTQLFIPLYQNFYFETLAHYPIHKDVLKISWMFDACLEGLGVRKGLTVLSELQSTIITEELNDYNFLLNELNNYLQKDKKEYYKNTFLDKAIYDYFKWLNENPLAKKSAKADFVVNLYNLYRIYKYEDLVRFLFYLETYFYDKPDNIKNMFSYLINSSIENPKEQINRKVEIVEIQDSFEDKTDKIVFKKMLFPFLSRDRSIDVVADTQSYGHSNLVVRTTIEDDDGEVYYIRNPLSPFEIGTLHKLFINDNYPIKIDDDLQYLVLIDKDEQFIVGGIIYKVRYPRIAHLEGIEVAKEFRQKNIGKRLIQDFFDRLSSIGMRTLTTHYFLRSFFEKFGFKNDEHWGGLVKFLVREDNKAK
ncbi:MAG TPA: GNAT family N-acetyltransferase, partial [Ignavibacteriaceae bacterium]|nr:GNAT family N-acetyltransferase [Ignavibacteriaceae bacterium]